jgi:hypothetical protein
MKVVTNKDGTMQTVPHTDLSAEKLKQTRKELRDMLSGNTQFHDDEWATPKEVPILDEQDDDGQIDFFGLGINIPISELNEGD